MTQLLGCITFHRGPMPGEPPAATYVQLGDTRVRYVTMGSGPPVVLVHGFASSLEVWDYVLPRLLEHHTVVALDLRGFGWTDRPPGDYSPAAQAQLVLALLDHLGIGQAAVVAHSWGASVALSLALAAPERVTRLALYDAWVYEEQLPPFFLWARARGVGESLFAMYYRERAHERVALGFHDPTFVTEALIDDVLRAFERPGTLAAALAAVRGQRFSEMQRRYGTIDKPVLLLWGREDRVARLAVAERLRRELPNARLEVYPRCGHFPMLEAAEASTRALAAFLREGA